MSKKSSSGSIFQLLFLVAILFVAVPGMMVLAIAKDYAMPQLELSQLWTFALLFDIAMLSILFLIIKNFLRSFMAYLIICILISAICLVSAFGFKATWPNKYASYYFEYNKDL